MHKLNIKKDHIQMMHGSGGKGTHQLIQQLFLTAYGNDYLSQESDGCLISFPSSDLIMTTDSYVINPLFFPGGNIGSLSIYGTVNDLAVSGAEPKYLSASFILEEGLPLSSLKEVINSMAGAANTCGIKIITGDTKVVEKGAGDGIYINTTGIGVAKYQQNLINQLSLGDVIIVSGPIGNHGMAVMSKRAHLEFELSIGSDSQPLHNLCQALFKSAPYFSVIRDITRGGLATVLNEWANFYGKGIVIDEMAVPIDTEVIAACELLGIDPLYVANEGVLVAACKKSYAEDVLNCMRKHPYGQKAAIIAEVVDNQAYVEMKTCYGGHRFVDYLADAQLPRIC